MGYVTTWKFGPRWNSTLFCFSLIIDLHTEYPLYEVFELSSSNELLQIDLIPSHAAICPTLKLLLFEKDSWLLFILVNSELKFISPLIERYISSKTL